MWYQRKIMISFAELLLNVIVIVNLYYSNDLGRSSMHF